MDHAATTPVRPEVVEAMAPFTTSTFGNPSSAHRWGREAASALDGARATLAAAIGARASEIRFVRGGTESDNLAVIGAARARPGPDSVVAVSSIEHSAVLEPARYLAAMGETRLVTLDVTAEGSMDVGVLEAALAGRTGTVSVMWVNNETGLLLPVDEVTRAAQASGAVMHTDASQAIGKVPVDVSAVPVDLLTGTGHKIGGPRGMGFLFMREGTTIVPLLHGGSQERRMRPGTEDVAGAVGLAVAVRLAAEEQSTVAARLDGLRAALERGLTTAGAPVRINCGEGARAPHVCSVGFAGVSDGEALLMALDLEGIAVSGGSACHSGAGKASHVIEALYGTDDPMATVRYSLGRSTTMADVDAAVEATRRVLSRVRAAA
jgi:cysteine desulfurase